MPYLWITLGLLINPVDGQISIRQAGSPARIRVTAKLSADLLKRIPEGPVRADLAEKVLRLQLRCPDGTLGAPVFSTYRRNKNDLVLVPRFNLVPGEKYVITLLHKSRPVAQRSHRVPVSYQGPPPVVKGVFPTSDKLPANQLKFYLHFSRPMREGRDIFNHIRLLDANGKEVAHPWRRQELWNAEATRLTLWIHPGRVKMGVKLREQEGPVLLPGHQYSLELGGKLKGADGQSLLPYRKTFSTVGNDQSRPLPANWKLSAVTPSSRDVLRIYFGETVDAELALRCLRVQEVQGRLVQGDSSLEDHESVWCFRPAKAWSKRRYRLLVDDELEDLGGNTPVRLFDTDLKERRLEPAVLELYFQPRADR